LDNSLHYFDSNVGSSNNNCMKDALWSCCKSFANKSGGSKQTEYRRIWIFTNDDNPYGSDNTVCDQTLTIAKDGAQMGIELSLWCMNYGSKSFDIDIFYKNLLTVNIKESSTYEDDDDDDEVEFLSIENRVKSAGNDGFQNVLSRITRKLNKKKRVCILPLIFGKDKADAQNEVNMMIQIHKVVKILDKPKNIPLMKATNEPVKSTTQNCDKLTGKPISDHEVTTCIEVGEYRLPIEKADVTQIKSGYGQFSPGIYMLAFAPKEIIFRTQNLEASYFLYPEETSVKGSRVLFKSVLQNMLKKGLVSLAKFVKNTTSEPRLCVVVPQDEEVDSMNQQLCPPGFHLIFLPYLDDLRCPPIDIPISTDSKVNDTMMSAAKNIINQLHYPPEYSYKDNISSIAIQKFYSCLQAVALETVVADVDQPKDTLVTNKQLLKGDVDVFNSILSIQTEKVKKARAPPKPKGEPANKKAKK